MGCERVRRGCERVWRGCEKNLSFIWVSFCLWFSLLVTSGKISCELPFCQEGRPHEAAWSEVVHSPSRKRDSSPQMKGRGLQGQVKTGGETKFLPPTRAHPGQIKRWKPNHSQVRIHHRILRTGSVFANFDSLFIENSLRIPVRTKDREARVKWKVRRVRIKHSNIQKVSGGLQRTLGVVGSTSGMFTKGKQHGRPSRHRPEWISESRQNSWQDPFGRSQTSLKLALPAQRRGWWLLFTGFLKFYWITCSEGISANKLVWIFHCYSIVLKICLLFTC